MLVSVVIEDPRGSTVRHHFDVESGHWNATPHPHTTHPWPANYGYVPGTWNQADRDALDVLVISNAMLSTGDQLTARVVGLLRRPDGDDKIVAVDAGDAALAMVNSLDQVPTPIVEEFEAWFAEWSPIGEWDSAEAGRKRVRESRLAREYL